MIETRYRLEKGVRLQRQAGGESILLVPAGIVSLDATAAAVLELADGTRSVEAIVAELAKRFAASAEALEIDVRDLLDALVLRGFVTRW